MADGGGSLTVAQWNAVNPISGSHNYDIDQVARAFYVAAIASDGDGLGMVYPDPLPVPGDLIVAGKMAIGGTALDQNRYLNLDVSISPTTQTYGVYKKILHDTSTNVSGDRSYVLATVPEGETLVSTSGQFGFTGNDGPGTIEHGYGLSGTASNVGTGTYHRALGVYGGVASAGPGGGTIDDGTAVEGALGFWVGGTVTEAACLEAKLLENVAGSEVTGLCGLKMKDWTNNGTVPNSWGIYLDNTINVGTTHYAMYTETGAGKVRIGDMIEAVSTTGPQFRATHTPGIDYFDITVDSDGMATLMSGNNYTRIGDAGTTSHSLAANDDLLVSGNLEVDGLTFLDGVTYCYGNIVVSANLTIKDGQSLRFGATTDASMSWSVVDETANLLRIHTDSAGRMVLITDKANYDKDHDHAAQDNPTLFGHSVTDPDTDNEQYWSITHDGTDAKIEVGTGDLNLGAENLKTTGRITPGEFIIPSGTAPGPAVEGALFLDTDASANGTLVCYSNGTWRTVATW